MGSPVAPGPGATTLMAARSSRWSPLAPFETGVNEPTRTVRFDVIDSVARAEGAGPGFRVELAADPTEGGLVQLGSGFRRTPPGVRLVVASAPPERRH